MGKKYQLTIETDDRETFEKIFEEVGRLLDKKGGTSSANKEGQKVIEEIAEPIK